jgi:RND family efflux transporter MFP subunit
MCVPLFGDVVPFRRGTMNGLSLQLPSQLACLRLVVIIALFAPMACEHCEAAPPPKTLVEPATAKAFDYADMYSLVNGTVKAIHVDIGDPVKMRQVLVELAAPDVKTDFEIKRLKVVEAEAELSQAQLARKAIEIEIEQAGRAKVNEAVAKVRLDVAKAAIEVANARVAIAKAELGRVASLVQATTLRATFAGIVTRRSIHVGDLVSAKTSAPSLPLVTVARTDRIRVVVKIPEQYVLRVEPHAPASIEFDALPGKVYSSKVSRTSGFLNPADRSMRAEIDLPNNKGELKDGMFGRVTIVLSSMPSD